MTTLADTMTDRLLGLARRCESLGIDGVLLTSRDDVRWATGFTGSAGVVLIVEGAGILVTDGRYVEQASIECPGVGIEVHGGQMWSTVRRLGSSCVTLAVDPAHVTVAEWDALRADDAERWVAVPELVAPLRRRKDPAEIEHIARASEIADAALTDVLGGGVVGASEREVRDALESAMRSRGADAPSYETIVASGPNASRPHHRPVDRRIGEGDSVVIDVGALVAGYHSDMTRTLLVGKVDPSLVETYELVREAQARGVAHVAPGVLAGDIDEACREVFRAAGRENDVVHGTGHGVGLQIHESPWLRRGSTDVLVEGDVLTVEPGLYRVGRDGVRIEDLLVVTADGCRTLTHATKDPTCPPSPRTT